MTKRKRNTQTAASKKLVKPFAIATPPHDDDLPLSLLEPRNLHAVVSQDELEIAVDTLQTLAQHSNIIKSKACKELRTAVYDFRQACTTGVNTAGSLGSFQADS